MILINLQDPSYSALAKVHCHSLHACYCPCVGGAAYNFFSNWFAAISKGSQTPPKGGA